MRISMKKSNWSQTYFEGLTEDEHAGNNHWFIGMLNMLKPTGKLFVPMLNKTFNKEGEEVE
jgi:hypothetical protein